MWSIKATGSAAKVAEKVKAWNNPIDATEIKHFGVCQQYVESVLNNCAPDTGVQLDASGFCAPDGRSSMTIKIDPIELHV